MKGKNKNQDLRCQSGPSAKDSVIFSGRDSSTNYGADQQRLQISDLHFDNFPTPATFACWKIRFETEVCTCSQFPTEAMQWIKWKWLIQWMNLDLRHLHGKFECRTLKYSMRRSLQRKSVWKNKKTQKEDRFLRGKQIAYLFYDNFQVTGPKDAV